MPYTETSFYAGLDLGQAQDYTALTIAERITQRYMQFEVAHYGGQPPPSPRYDVRHLERLKLGTSYPDQVKHVKQLLERPQLQGKVKLVLDFTGVGRPVADMFHDAKMPCPVSLILIHGGNTVVRAGLQYHVPKRDLVSVTQVLLQSGRLHIAEALPESATLTKEMQNFKMKISAGGHDSYESWRENIHDDLVLSLAIALWTAEHGGLPAQSVEVEGLW
jgi:hypothetical protein